MLDNTYLEMGLGIHFFIFELFQGETKYHKQIIVDSSPLRIEYPIAFRHNLHVQ